MTLSINTSESFTDDTLPIFPLEAVAGTVLLLEPGRSPGYVGAPGDGGTVPDLSGWLVGAGSTVISENMVPGVGIVERTAKGGIHAIVTRDGTFCSYGIYPNQAVRQYILSNLSHRFYISVHGRVTRKLTSPLDAHFCLTFSSVPSDVNLLLAALATGEILPTGATVKLIKKYPVGTLVNAPPQPLYIGAAVEGHSGPADRTAAQTGRSTHLFQAGRSGTFSQGEPGHGSKIFYRAFIEDLTVSGRTAAQISEIDYGWFESDVLAQGGYYFGDTYTDPAVLP